MGEVQDAISRAIGTSYQTKPVPRSVGAQARYLLAREKGSVAAAARRVGVTPRTFKGWTQSHDLKKRITPAKAAKLHAETEKEWQPGLRRAAIRQLATNAAGVVVETRAQFGFTSAAGSTDDPRMRRITQALPADVAQQLAAGFAGGRTEQQLRDQVALGLQQYYFREGGTRAQDLICELTDIQYIDLDFQ